MGASDLVPGVTREADLGPAVSFPGPGARPLRRIIENKVALEPISEHELTSG